MAASDMASFSPGSGLGQIPWFRDRTSIPFPYMYFVGDSSRVLTPRSSLLRFSLDITGDGKVDVIDLNGDGAHMRTQPPPSISALILLRAALGRYSLG